MTEFQTFLSVMGGIIIAGLSGTIWAFRKGGIYNPMPSNDSLELPIPIDTTPVVETPVVPAQPPTNDATALLWDTQQQAFHSVRVMCDLAGLDVNQKNEICYTIWGESQFNTKIIGKPNKNGTKDYGIAQYNDGTNAKDIPFWIGEGATFASTDEVLNNPAKCVRVMIQTYKVGHIGWWYGHKGYSQSAVKSSPMWKLRV